MNNEPLILTIDIREVKNTRELFQKFCDFFGFPDYFGYNWSAFHDCMRTLDTDSKLISENFPECKRLHLIIDGYWVIKKVLTKEEHGMFDHYVAILTDTQTRNDNIFFTFEVRWAWPEYYLKQ